nr:hypothetical protein [uncultured Cetobacterium sp.]
MFVNIDLNTNEILYVIGGIGDIPEDSLKYFKEVQDTELDFNKAKYFKVDKNVTEYTIPVNYVKAEFDYRSMIFVDIATQEEFLQSKKLIENQIREIYKDIELSKTLNLNFEDYTLKLEYLNIKLEYVKSKIIIKV